MVDAAALILFLKPAIESKLQQATSYKKDGVVFAFIKSIEMVSKSLLSRCLPYET